MEYLCSRIVHHFLGSQVTLIAHQELVHALIGVSVDLIKPLLHVVEAVLVGDIIDNLSEEE